MHHIHHKHSHTSHYLVLFLLIVTGFFAFVGSRGFPLIQLKIGIVTAISYSIWGTYHHHLTDDLNWKIMVEYISISLLGIVLFWFLLTSQSL